MRAVLRALGRRNDKMYPRNPAERTEVDQYVRVLIRALNAHPQLRPAWPNEEQPSAALDAVAADEEAGELELLVAS